MEARRSGTPSDATRSWPSTALWRAPTGTRFLIQLGPVANILAGQMLEENADNTYLDMGHSLDGVLYGEPCRGFMIGEPAAPCADMDIAWEP